MKKTTSFCRLVWQHAIGLIIFALLGFSSESFAARAPIRIAYFTSNSKGNTYWPQVFRVMEEVARDLQFEFIHYDFGAVDRFELQDRIINVINSDIKLDGILTVVVQGNTKPILEAAEKRGIPVFVHGPVFPSELDPIGLVPRKKYKQWIAYFYQDEFRKGYLLAKNLISTAEKKQPRIKGEKVEVVGLGGRTSWYGSLLRRQGLEKALEENPRALLHQIVPTYWKKEEGDLLSTKMLKRFPNTSVIWAANDLLAIGAASALTRAGKQLGRSAFTGGIDLSDNGMHRVKEGILEATVASSMMSYAELLIYLYDYIHGIDFAPEVGVDIKTDIQVVTKENVDLHLTLSDKMGSIDFKEFSKFYQPKLKKYDFSFDAFLKAASITK